MGVAQTGHQMAAPDSMVNAAPDGPSLVARGVTAAYWIGQPVFHSVDLDLVGPGWWVLTAANGVGKSTLFEVLAGFLAYEGHVQVCGQPIRRGRPVRQVRVQRSDPAFVPGVTLRDHLHLQSVRYGIDRRLLEELAGRLELNTHLDKAPESVSTGTLKKAWFVAHSAGDEPVLCLDEPFNGVDIKSVGVMVRHLAAISQTRLVLMTSHQMPDKLAITETRDAAPFRLQRLEFRGTA